jgi:hypothetical protein
MHPCPCVPDFSGGAGSGTASRPHLRVPPGGILGLPGHGQIPFRPALTAVLISQAGRPESLRTNFWGPTGSSFSGTKRGKSWAGPKHTTVAQGTLLGA